LSEGLAESVPFIHCAKHKNSITANVERGSQTLLDIRQHEVGLAENDLNDDDE
jgi:hypothetical protein